MTLFSQPSHVLKSVFGYDRFLPGQEEIVLRLIEGRDALLIMPTGGGKSVCYQLPALIREGTGIVVSPLISLMKDQVDALLQLGVRAAYLNSSLPPREQREVIDRMVRGDLDLLYVAPERLLTDGFLEQLDRTRLALLAIDEAHCISQWGHDFRPEYQQLTTVRRRYPDVPCIAVTATADGPTRRDIARGLHFDDEDLFVTGFDRPNIRYTVVMKHSVRQQLWRFLQEEHPDDAGIVYCMSRNKVEEIAAWLVDQGRTALPYHAGLSARDRELHQERFSREEGIVMVATVAFGMGIDKPNVRFVAHVDVPKSPEAYYQETGRAGRDGLPANAWMAYSLADVIVLQRMMDASEADRRHRSVERHKLNAIIGYCETAGCRRQVLLNYFGEHRDEPCGNCDNCLYPVETWDGTVAAQKVMSCVARTGQRFGVEHIVDVLLGNETDKVQRFGHRTLSTFGIGTEHTAGEWRSVIRQLIAAGFMRVDIDGYGGLHLTSLARPVLQGARPVQLRRDPAPAGRKKKRAPTTPTTGGATDPGLFEHLRSLRLTLSREQGVPPYVIFHDRTLAAMAELRPTTQPALADVPGVGAAKLERYGERFLSAIRAYDEARGK